MSTVRFLDRNGVCQDTTFNESHHQLNEFYIALCFLRGEKAHALMDATMLGQTSIVISLLREGADPNPNFGSHKGRLRKGFKSSSTKS